MVWGAVYVEPLSAGAIVCSVATSLCTGAGVPLRHPHPTAQQYQQQWHPGNCQKKRWPPNSRWRSVSGQRHASQQQPHVKHGCRKLPWQHPTAACKPNAAVTAAAAAAATAGAAAAAAGAPGAGGPCRSSTASAPAPAAAACSAAAPAGYTAQRECSGNARRSAGNGQPHFSRCLR